MASHTPTALVLRRGLAKNTARMSQHRIIPRSNSSSPVIGRCFSTKLSKSHTNHERERVVILGSGWAGYAVARNLDKSKFEPIVVSPRSYFVFTPLLASTAVGTLEFRTVLEPVRRISGVGFCQGWAEDIDFTNKTVRVESNAADDPASKTVVPADPTGPPGQGIKVKGEVFDISYDKLIIACGAYSQTFGIQGVREHAHFLRDIGDARRLRLRVLSLFEQCAIPDDNSKNTQPHLTEADKRHLLHFAIVGGGPTGIEYAAELHDLIYEDLAKIYPQLLQYVTITVYDVAPKVLPMFDQALATYAMEAFSRQGINVKTEHHLEQIRLSDGHLGKEHGALSIKIKEYGPDKEVGAGLVVWSTGLMANPLIQKLASKEFTLPANHSSPSPVDSPLPIRKLSRDPRTGSLLTDQFLRAQYHTPNAPISPSSSGQTPNNNPSNTISQSAPLEDVFVIGDCSQVTYPSAPNSSQSSQTHNQILPKTAQVASQQATHLSKVLNKNAVTTREFKFRNWGTLTYLGSWKAIHQSSADELKGWTAWVFWRGAYMTKSMSVRNKILVPIYWLVSWLFGRGISRF